MSGPPVGAVSTRGENESNGGGGDSGGGGGWSSTTTSGGVTIRPGSSSGIASPTGAPGAGASASIPGPGAGANVVATTARSAHEGVPCTRTANPHASGAAANSDSKFGVNCLRRRCSGDAQKQPRSLRVSSSEQQIVGSSCPRDLSCTVALRNAVRATSQRNAVTKSVMRAGGHFTGAVGATGCFAGTRAACGASTAVHAPPT